MSLNSLARLTELGAVALVEEDQAVNAAVVYVAGLGQATRSTARHSLQVIASIVAPGVAWDRLPWYRLRAEHIAAIRAELATARAFTTVNKMLIALRGTLRTAWRLGQLGAEDLTRALDVKPLRGERLPAGRDISPAELAALFATCDGSTVGRRDAAILALGSMGLRRAELIGLDLADVDQAAGVVTVRAGKGSKDRTIPLAPGARAAVMAWIACRGDQPGPLLISTWGSRPGTRLSPKTIWDIIQRRAAWAGIASISPHDLRRTLAGDLLDAGVDILTAGRILGHSSPATTARYDRRPEEAKRAAVDRLTIPYVPPAELVEK